MRLGLAWFTQVPSGGWSGMDAGWEETGREGTFFELWCKEAAADATPIHTLASVQPPQSLQRHLRPIHSLFGIHRTEVLEEPEG